MNFVSGSSLSNIRRAPTAIDASAPPVAYASTTTATGRNIPKRYYADNDVNQALTGSYGAQMPDQASSGLSTASSGVVRSHRHHDLRAMPGIAEDRLEMNSASQPGRPKRHRESPSLMLGSGPLSAGPSMPAGGSVRTNPLTTTSITSSMSHVEQDPAPWMSRADEPQVEQTDAARASNTQSGLGTARDSLSRILSRSLLDFEDPFEPTPEYRTNRMSWIPDNTASNNTIHTNTEPGWNLTAPLQEYAPAVSSSHSLPPRGLTLDIDAANQSYRSAFSSNEAPQPVDRMTNPSGHPPSSQAQDSRLFYSQSDSEESFSSPMDWTLHETRTQPAQGSTGNSAGSWWPTQWNYAASRNPTLIAPMRPSIPRRISQEAPEMSNNHHRATASTGEPFNLTPAHTSRHSADTEWEPTSTQASNNYRDHLPPPQPWSFSPIHATPQPSTPSAAVPTSPWDFPEPQIHHEPVQTSPTHSRHRLGHVDNLPSRAYEYATGNSWDQIPTSRPAYWDLPAIPPVPPPRPTLSNVQGRSVRFHEDAPRRLHSPPPPPQPSSGSRFLGIQSLLDRYSRRTAGTGEGTRAGASHSRSASEGSRNTMHSAGSGTNGSRDGRNRRAERVETWMESSRSSGMPFPRPEIIEPLDPFPTANGSLYDHPSMRDILSSHGEIHGPRHGRERLGSGLFDHSIFPSPSEPLQEDLDFQVEHSQPGRSWANRPLPARPGWAALRPHTPVEDNTPPEPTSYYSSMSPTAVSRPESPPVPSRTLFDWPEDIRPWSRRRREESAEQGRLSRIVADPPFALFGLEDDLLIMPSLGVEEEPAHSTASRRALARARRHRSLRTLTLTQFTHRMRVMGDYVLDDDFDDSYEALVALTQHIGPVKRGCSQKSLEELISGTYKEFSESTTEKVAGDNGSCAICLEDYQPEDPCVKLPRCSHVYHQACIKEWLKSAKTCPVCRETVEGPPRSEGSPARRSSLFPRRSLREPVLQRILDEATTSQPGPSTTNPRRSSTRRRMMDDVSAEPTRRERAPRRVTRPTPTLGEYDDPWPGYSPTSPEAPFPFHSGPAMTTHTTSTETSARFVRGPLAQALRETPDVRLRY